ncbi:hypothetical protein ACUWCL_29440, partial [Klebsiella pneumoniae]|uniref:hypothetical protein n=1 Tax=Klebsiella pneumoniae TaxID=573 RepID=UPI0040553A8A
RQEKHTDKEESGEDTVVFTMDLPIVYSDGCTYQNRNVIMANAMLLASKITGFHIVQKYLTKGHTQMEVDSVHATIEREFA